MKKSKHTAAIKSKVSAKKPPARAADMPRNALRDLAPPKGKALERLPARSAAKTKPAKRPRPGLFQ
jgi:hypothetical protein